MSAAKKTKSTRKKAGSREPKAASVTRAPASSTPFHRLHIWQIQAFRDVLFVAAVIALIWLGYALSAVTVPLLVALLLAYLVEPLVQWLMGKDSLGLSRVRAVTLILIGVIGAFLIVLAIVIPLAVGQTTKLVRNFNDGTLHAQISRATAHVPAFLQEEFHDLLEVLPSRRNPAPIAPAEIEVRAEGAEDDAAGPTGTGAALPNEEAVRRIVREEIRAQQLQRPPDNRYADIAGRGMDIARTVIGRVLAVGLLIGLIPFYFFFFSLWYPSVLKFFRDLTPKKHRKRVFTLIRQMDAVIAGFVRGRIVIALISGGILAVGWYIVSVPYAIVLGLVTGIFSVVPYLSAVGLPIAIALLFFEQLSIPPDDRGLWLGWFGVFLWPTMIFVLYQLVETYILTPKIAGKATNLDPVTVVVAVIAGGALLGVYGMLLAIPLAACLKILITEVVAPRVNEWLKGERSDPLPIGRGED